MTTIKRGDRVIVTLKDLAGNPIEVAAVAKSGVHYHGGIDIQFEGHDLHNIMSAGVVKPIPFAEPQEYGAIVNTDTGRAINVGPNSNAVGETCIWLEERGNMFRSWQGLLNPRPIA